MDPVIVISLEKAKERRQKMQDQLLELQIDGFIMDAVDGSKLPPEELNKKISLPNGWRQGELFKPGEVGCMLSHIKALEWARDKNWPYLILLEDDTILSEDFNRRLKILFSIIPNDWQHIYLTGIPRFSMLQMPNLQFPNIVDSVFTETTAGMVIRQSSYDYIIKFLKEFWTTADDSYCELIKRGLKSYTYFPFCVAVEDNYSFIWDVSITRKHKSFQYFRNKL